MKKRKVLSDKFIKSVTEGLLAYRIYLSKCKVSQALSEYSFYEPLQRMFSSNHNWIVKCEYPFKRQSQKVGDNKRIDFVIGHASKNGDFTLIAAIEIKIYLSNKYRPNIQKIKADCNKLIEFEKLNKPEKIGKWLLVLHDTDEKLSNKLIQNDFTLSNVIIKSVNKTYRVEILKVK